MLVRIINLRKGWEVLEVAALSGVVRISFSKNVSSEQIFERNMGMSQADHQSEE